jgi:fatty acid desaturase
LVDSQNLVKRYHRTAATPQSRWRRVCNAALITVLLVAFTLLMLPLFLFLAVFSAWKSARGRNERLPERARWLASALLVVSLTACDL